MAGVVAITGASGVVGRKLSYALEASGSIGKIIQIDIHEQTATHPKVEFIQADIRHPLIADVLRTYHVDTLIHLAFHGVPVNRSPRAHEVNVIGTMKLLNACSAARIKKIIVASTSAVYGAAPTNPNFIRERMVTSPPRNFPAVRDRLEVEKLCLDFARKHPTVMLIILRLGMMVGGPLENFITRTLEAPVIPVVMGFDPLLQFVHEQDVVQAFQKAVEKDISGIFNIAGPGAVPLSKIIRSMGKPMLPVPSRMLVPLLSLLWRLRLTGVPSGLIDYLKYLWAVDIDKARRELGFSPAFTSEQAIMEVIEHLRIKPFLETSEDDLLIPDIKMQENLESFVDSRIKKIIDQDRVDSTAGVRVEPRDASA
ncbi:NAD-dependent epimerase/dehydratase family protein [bacterium]|nr:NAD-dependent epimerase/dehydratase family protein [candidate division CSSED10-310 bacterium]